MAAVLQPAIHNPQKSQLIMLYICPKFRENILKDFRVIERARFVMDRQTDRQLWEKQSVCPSCGMVNVISQGLSLIVLTGTYF